LILCHEKGKGDISAIQEVEKNFGIQVLSIISLSHLVDYLKQGSDQALIERIEASYLNNPHTITLFPCVSLNIQHCFLFLSLHHI
jgi:hypothetical protein